MSETAGVCDELAAAGARTAAVAGRRGSGGSSDGPGIESGSLTGLADSGASVEMAREPGENHTSTLARPVFMIENIRTSKYDRCSDM
jgi:hypothetical protein